MAHRERAAKTKERSTRNKVTIMRVTVEEKARWQAVKELMKVSSTSEVFRRLLNAKATELGIN